MKELNSIFTNDDFSLFLLLRISSAAPLILEAEGMFFLVLRSGLEENSSCSFWLSSDTNQALKLSWQKSGALVSSSVVGLLPGSTLRHEDTKLIECSLLPQEYVTWTFYNITTSELCQTGQRYSYMLYMASKPRKGLHLRKEYVRCL